MKTLLLFLIFAAATLAAQPDNRYCGAGDVPAFGAQRDGPASLPASCINTAISSSPSPGKVIRVAAGESVQVALDQASCGDQVLLQSGTTFPPFTLPAKTCDARHWITVRTSAPDSMLPPEGSRITPCYAGITSLPGRPPYVCPTTTAAVAKVELKSGAGAITVAPGANHYRLMGLEVTRTPGTGTVYALIRFPAGADHIIIDRSWVHGSALDETVRGVYLGGSRNVGIIDSYFNDFHCIAMVGTCTDAQAIAGGNSRLAIGTYKIVNNFLEAAAENILFGGAGGSEIPADIEIRRNHLFKPLTWLPGSSNFIGKKFIVKNLLELKNAQRVLFEGNVLENSWGGFSQIGWGIVLTPRGSWAAVQDIIIRHDMISHVGAGMQLAASKADNGTDSLAAQRWNIHDVILDDLDAAAYDGGGVEFQISSHFGNHTPLNHVVMDHITAVTDAPVKNLMLVGANPNNPRLPFDITFNNNIVVAGRYSVWSIGSGPRDCARSGDPSETFRRCWSSFEVRNNVIIGGGGGWPHGNMSAKDGRGMEFVNFNHGKNGDYRLRQSSRYKLKGGDGKDPGADVNAVLQAISGVR